jgi:nitrogen fixation/metabolism regulation signal transduction histidine kinase
MPLCRRREWAKMRAMAGAGRIRRRLALAIVLTALIPLLAAIWLVNKTVRDTSARFFMPDIGTHLERSLDLYQELARAVKAGMRQEASAIAAQQSLQSAALAADRARLHDVLEASLRAHPTLVSLSVQSGAQLLSSVDRGRPLDPDKESQLEVVKPLAQAAAAQPSSDEDEDSPGPELVAVFAADKARFDELGEMSQFVDDYHKLEQLREDAQVSNVRAFTALLGLTILAAVGVALLLARDVSRRIAELSRATQRVAAGDLTTRVPAQGGDELTDLALAFNRMVGEVEASRARIEYLQRISAWQEMARRLAHEIKNPLTPIQLAVQEIHRRYAGQESEYRRLLDTTLEVVEDEVATLRRLVSEFSDFARLPHAELERADLAVFLRELAEQPLLSDEDQPAGLQGDVSAAPEISFDVPGEPAEVMMDRQMLRRVVINLLRNAAQALAQHPRPGAKIVLRLERKHRTYELAVEDNGPGIPKDLRESVFDPYVTTKTYGTGLGLAIAKKIVIEHGGTIAAGESDLGGARLCVRLPLAEKGPGPRKAEAPA